MENEEALKQINRSGFPFQLKVADEISATTNTHGWVIESREHAWSNSSRGSSEGYIDIVLRHQNLVTVRLAIECKRVKADDERQLSWSFLLPGDKKEATSVASCLEVQGKGERVQSGAYAGTYEWTDRRVWDNVRITPESFESEFSIVISDNSGRQPLLERLASELLDSIEGLAEEEVRVKKSHEALSLRLFIFPVILTNAEIVACRFESAKVDIKDGTLGMDNVEIETVPFIRFRKSISTSFPMGSFSGLEAANKAREQTIFVVNSGHINEFLNGWKLSPLDSFDGYAKRAAGLCFP